VEVSDHYWVVHGQMEQEGKIKHSIRHCPELTQPVRVKMWRPQEGWTKIQVPPVSSQ
jgi:hypothetical protein